MYKHLYPTLEHAVLHANMTSATSPMTPTTGSFLLDLHQSSKPVTTPGSQYDADAQLKVELKEIYRLDKDGIL